MNFGIRGLLASVAMLAGASSSLWAAPVPVSVDFTALRCLQTYARERKADDHGFAVVNGIAAGKEFQARFPEGDKTWETNNKKMAVSDKAPLNLWKGTLDDGQFAIVSLSVFQGEGKDAAAIKGYQDSLIAAEKKTPEYDKKTLTADDFKKLTGDASKKFITSDLVVNERAVISKIKDTFSREKNTDHYGGLVNIIVWNNAGKIQKAVVPVGLTFGENDGVDPKIYTKLKFTRNNVFIEDASGEFSNVAFSPLSDDEATVHVKMLENELVKAKDGSPFRKTTDYVADVQVKVDGKPLKWSLMGENTGVDEIHRFWEFAN